MPKRKLWHFFARIFPRITAVLHGFNLL